MRTYPKLLRTDGKLAPKFGVGAPKFENFQTVYGDIYVTFQLRAMRPSVN